MQFHLLLAVFLCSFAELRVEAKPAAVASIEAEDLVEFDEQPEEIQQLISTSLSLTRKKLTYTFGSNTPGKSGMDCSGTVQYTLKSLGIEEVPRSSYQFYQWADSRGTLTETRGVETTEDPVFETLKPGDLLFWEGTYNTGKKNPPISHVMIYLGRLKSDGRGVVFGASDGRRFRGKRITGVSVFDWKVPSKTSSSKFVGFSPIPGFASSFSGEDDLEGESDKASLKSFKSGLEKLFRKRDASSQ